MPRARVVDRMRQTLLSTILVINTVFMDNLFEAATEPTDLEPPSPRAAPGRPRRQDPLPQGGAPGRQGRAQRITLRVLSVLAFFALWWGLTKAGVWDPLFIPRPGAVWDRLIESLQTKTTTTSSGFVI